MSKLLITSIFTIINLQYVHANYGSCQTNTESGGLFSFLPAVHQCKRGHRCIYERGGYISDYVGKEGYHTHTPLLDTVHNVKVTWDTDSLSGVECGSKKGSKAFLDIHVINKLSDEDACITRVFREFGPNYDRSLIYDYIPTEVSQFCKQFTIDEIKVEKYDLLDEILMEKLVDNIKTYNLQDCISIKTVRIEAPRLDSQMQKKFEAIELEEKDKALEIKKKETEKVRQDALMEKETMEKRRMQATKVIEAETQKLQASAESERQAIVDNMTEATVRKNADSEKYRLEKLAEGNEKLLSNPNYIKLEGYKSAHSNAKLIIGDVPQNTLMNLGSTSSLEDMHHVQASQ